MTRNLSFLIAVSSFANKCLWLSQRVRTTPLNENGHSWDIEYEAGIVRVIIKFGSIFLCSLPGSLPSIASPPQNALGLLPPWLSCRLQRKSFYSALLPVCCRLSLRWSLRQSPHSGGPLSRCFPTWAECSAVHKEHRALSARRPLVAVGRFQPPKKTPRWTCLSPA